MQDDAQDASMDLGASPTRASFKVTLPLIIPGIVAAVPPQINVLATAILVVSLSCSPWERSTGARVSRASRAGR
jgi:ABC-type spermidine/putrescine transport system permease subunit I